MTDLKCLFGLGLFFHVQVNIHTMKGALLEG